MNIELGIMKDGNVVLLSDQPLPDFVRRVEYYREQRLFMLVYKKIESGNELMDYEIPATISPFVERSPNVMISSLYPGQGAVGYKVPLVQIGQLY